MNRFLKFGILAAALGATTLGTFSAAQADDWGGHRWRHGGGWHGGGWHRSNDGLLAAGVAGLAVGALASGLATRPAAPYYDGYYDGPIVNEGPVYGSPVYEGPIYQRRVYVESPRVVYRSAQPWSRAWYNYCSARYRSFDPQSGTFIGNDGRQHFCVAN